MGSETVNIPESPDEMRLRHLPFLLGLHEVSHIPIDEIPTLEVCRLNSIITGVPREKLGRYTGKANRDLFKTVLEVIKEYKPKPIPQEIEFNGQVYTLRGDFTKNPIDWADDLQHAEQHFKDNPADLVSFCYIEKGMEYGQPDGHQNPINPRSKRNKVFEEHLPLSTFLDIQAFFLWSWHELQPFLIKEKLKKIKSKLKSTPSNGKKPHSKSLSTLV
jgi:hypothetical protein